ncbi:MAG TPA: aliphatic sulfonate ABC transporter substrate-binding protein [Candidatus Baltobacteraceae bacterium]|nr:aliphatic sulfonate ABC transporter substrate-binding protein [Candidatus Baltobacteraceae bacterium]
MDPTRREAIGLASAALAALALPGRARAAGKLDALTLDYAYYNPVSLILKQNGWIERALAPAGTNVSWVLSLGSNKANQFLASGSAQFASTAGSAALLARANGVPLHTVFLYSQPEWTAIVVGRNSKLRSLRELKDKRIAATRGTDPWFFLLRALASVGLSSSDVQIVELQHPDGRVALERGQVDAWAGLDPHMAASQLEAGSRLLYRNIAWNTYGALNAREDFLTAYPDVVRTVLRTYELGHAYAKAHPDETAKILAEASNLDVKIASLVINDRTRFTDPVPGKAYLDSVGGTIPVIRSEQLVADVGAVQSALGSLADPAPARVALAHA